MNIYIYKFQVKSNIMGQANHFAASYDLTLQGDGRSGGFSGVTRSPGRTPVNGISAPMEEPLQRWLAFGPARPQRAVPRAKGPRGPCCSPPPPRTSSLRNWEKLNSAAQKVPAWSPVPSPSVDGSIASGLRSSLVISLWKLRPEVREVGLRSKG